MTDEDEANLADLKDIDGALVEAHQALTRAMIGLDVQMNREKFIFKIGFMRGRLARISERICRGPETGP